MAASGLILRRSGIACAAAVCSFALAGCTSNSRAKADARTAYLAGQQESMMRMQQSQNQGPVVTVQGQVRNNVVPWTEDLTVAKAIVAADYFGRTDPREIILVRQRFAKRIDPRTLLSGTDVPLQPGDILELR
jgi:hypothetical protein